MEEEKLLLEQRISELENNKADEVTPMLFDELFFSFLLFYLLWLEIKAIVVVKVQIHLLEKKSEQEHKTLELKVIELEKKLEGAAQELAGLESTLAIRNSDLAALQSNLKELEELREMKEVIIYAGFFILFSLFTLSCCKLLVHKFS